MGKVGSQTLASSLSQTSVGQRTISVHFLGKGFKTVLERHRQARLSPGHLETSRALIKQIDRLQNGGCQIITAVRDPVARAVSNLFQNPELLDAPISKSGTIDPDTGSKWLAQRLSQPDAFEYVETWFNSELRDVFGIDVFQTPFNHEAGWTVIDAKRISVLILRTEDLSRSGGLALARFLGIADPVTLASSNVRSDTSSGRAYREVLSNFRLPRPLLKEIYSLSLPRHFYSKEERDSFIRRWSSS